MRLHLVVAANLPNDEEHAKRVLSIITDVSVAITRRLTSSPVVHRAALCLLCLMVPWSLGGLPPLHWMCLVTCLTSLRTLTW
jgi:hypothetical protein